MELSAEVMQSLMYAHDITCICACLVVQACEQAHDP